MFLNVSGLSSAAELVVWRLVDTILELPTMCFKLSSVRVIVLVPGESARTLLGVFDQL